MAVLTQFVEQQQAANIIIILQSAGRINDFFDTALYDTDGVVEISSDKNPLKLGGGGRGG